MKRFSKLIMLLMVASTLFYSCKKDVTIEDAIASKEVDLAFDLAAIGNQFSASDAAFKTYGTKPDGSEQLYPTCTEEEATSVKVTMDGQVYNIAFTLLGTGSSTTEVIKVLAGSHTITEFEVLDSNGTPIYSAPATGSKEQIEGSMIGMPYTFTLTEFTKTAVDIDVVCWHEFSYQPLAWNWFEIDYNKVKTLCFFGDTCSKFFDDWGANGYDFVTAFKVDLYSGTTIVSSGQNFTQGELMGNGPVCVEYVDNELLPENLSFVISMVMPDGSLEVVGGETVAEEAYSDDQGAGNFGGSDGIWDFTVGNCSTTDVNDADSDYVFPAYLSLPETATFRLNGPLYGDGYAGLTISNVPAGDYAWGTQTYFNGWCGAKNDQIFLNRDYPSKVYSSLELATIPSIYSGINWDALNWIANNQGDYTNQEIQNAIWFITDNFGGGNGLSNDAIANSTNYQVPVGGWAVVLFDPIEANIKDANIQLFIVRVDP